MKTIAKILTVSVLGVLTACTSNTANQNSNTAQSQPQAKEQAKAADSKAADAKVTDSKAEFPDIDVKELNKYFTEIAMSHLDMFKEGQISDAIMIEFAMNYLWINSFNSFTVKETDAFIADKEVEKVTMKFFDTKPSKHQSTSEGWIKYNNGVYQMPCADGGEIRVALVNKLNAKNGSKAEYSVTIYHCPDEELDILLDKSKWDSELEDDEPEAIHDVKVTLTYKDGKYYVSGWQYLDWQYEG